VFLIITFITTTERVHPPRGQKTELRKDLADLFSNKAWLLIGGATVFQLVFIVMRNSSILYYFKYYVQAQQLHLFGTTIDLPYETFTSSFLLSGTVFNILGAILTKWISKRFDKKNTYAGCLLLSALLSCVAYFLQPQDVILIYLLNILISFIWGPVSVLQWAMYTDAADFSEWKHHRRATGLVMAASLFALKLGLTLGGAMVGWMLAYYGYVANQTQSAGAIQGIVGLMTYAPAVFGFVAVALMFFYPLTNTMMEKIERDLTARRAQEEAGALQPQTP
jgi:GPH family glycoside/pentoside/hexuronide:cation symporter